jgi:CBS-domain-containing membrane protein
MERKTVADIMNPKVLYIREGDRLTLARRKILEFGITAVPILDDTHRPVGVVSLRDLDSDPEQPSTTGTVVSVRGDASVEDAAKRLADENVHHLVVIDELGVAIGMVSSLDVVRAFVGMPASHPPTFDRY